MNPDAIISTSVQFYENIFNNFLNQFLQWGEWLFYSFLIIAIVWLCLWRAFDQNSFQESMPYFLKEFFIVSFFYTLMINCAPWLGSIVNTANEMGNTLVHGKVDPSTIISVGIMLGNLIMEPTKNAGILSLGFSLIICSISYVIVLTAFFSIALDLAVTLIVTSFLISASALFLAFAALPFTRSVARNALDVVIANSFKILTLYAVVGSGQGLFSVLASMIPPTKISNYDIYGWLVAVALLFWLVSKNLPEQVAKIVSNIIQENRGTDAAALAMSAVKIAQTAVRASAPAASAAGGVAANLAKIAGSSASNATAHFDQARTEGIGLAKSISAAAGGAMNDLKQATGDSLTDRFKHIQDKMTGGPGLKQHTPEGKALPLPGTANRMYHATQNLRSNSSAPATPGQSSSAGREAAAASSIPSPAPSADVSSLRPPE
ncbi:MAG: type IV secretion system protein [Gammaproteobacteria bacterium]